MSLAVLWALAIAATAGPGATRAEAIVGGSNAGAYPYMARITTRGSLLCSGALIRPEWVLTAGHCVDALHPWDHTVRMGTSNTATLRDYTVAGIRRNPAWPNQPGSDPNLDVALIRLATPVTDITPVTLGLPSDNSRFDGPSDSARAIGWGLTSCNANAAGNCTTPVFPTRLQTKLGTIPSAGDVLRPTFTNGGPCGGDSGSPLLVSTPDRGEVVVGELSKAGCENGSAAYVNVATGPARDWVLSVLDSGVSEQTERPWTAGPAPVNQRVCFDAGDRDLAAEPINLIPGRPAYRTSWWVYDPGPVAHRFHVTTTGSAVDTVAAVFESTGDTLQYDLLQRRLSNDDSGGTRQSSVVGTTLSNKPGEVVYLIAVGTYSQATTGRVCVQLLDAAPATSSTGGDILWHNSQTNETQVWYMDRNRLRSRGTVLGETGSPVYIGPPFKIVATGDFNGDRKADILWHNKQTNETQIWYMSLHWLDGRATVLGEDGNPVYIGPPFKIVGASDFNADGKADILWYNSQTGETQIWYMNLNRLVSRATVLGEDGNPVYIGPPFKIAGTNDFNADRKADILWHNSQTGETQIWYMNLNRLTSRATVLGEDGNPVYIGPPFKIVGTGVFNPLS